MRWTRPLKATGVRAFLISAQDLSTFLRQPAPIVRSILCVGLLLGNFFFAWEDGTLLGRAAGLTHAPPPFNPALFSIWAGKSVIKKRSRFGFGERKKEKE